MKFTCLKIILFSIIIANSCSLPPERKITINELKRSDLAYYTIKDDINSVLDALNKTGEAVVTADYYDKEVLIKIYATSNEGILVEQFQGKD